MYFQALLHDTFYYLFNSFDCADVSEAVISSPVRKQYPVINIVGL